MVPGAWRVGGPGVGGRQWNDFGAGRCGLECTGGRSREVPRGMMWLWTPEEPGPSPARTPAPQWLSITTGS